jgi:hypothetical protein
MSARTKTKNYNKQQTNKNHSVGTEGGCNSTPSIHPALQRAWGLIQKSDYAGAAALLAAAGRDPQVRNTLGVCLMRMGSVDKAVDVFRSFVLMPGTALERREVSNASKRNFATALLMKGFPSGTLSVLAEIHEPDHPMAVRLYSAITQWEKSLSWFRRLDWKLNGVEPRNCQVPLDFEPGEFDFDVKIQRPIQPGKPGNGSLKVAA